MFSLLVHLQTCSGEELLSYDRHYNKFLENGIDDVYCISVNDAFVMNVGQEI